MKLAVFDPRPRMCGPTQYGFAIRDAFISQGFDADVVSFTKSGKPTSWWGAARTDVGFSSWGEVPNVVAKWSEAASVLKGYDLVFLTEPRCPPLDRLCEKKGLGEPPYVRAVLGCKVPWATRLGGPLYDEKRAPYLGSLLQREPLFVMSQRKSFARSGAWAGLPGCSVIKDPYMHFRHGNGYSDKRAVGSVGRVMPQKGAHTLLAFAKILPLPVKVMGASSTGMGATFSFKLTNMMRHLGYDVTIDEPPGVSINTKRKRPMPWVASMKHNGRERVARYTGAYADGVKAAERVGVWVSLTSKSFSYALERSTMEAMDAGCLMVLPKHLAEPGMAAIVLEEFESNPSLRPQTDEYRFDLLGRPAAEELAGALQKACKVLGTGEHVRMAQQNTSLLDEAHGPRDFVRRVLEVTK